jgi:hypothetical protein
MEVTGKSRIMPEMMPVTSSRISEYGYDADTATIYVRFTDGKGWQYKNVPQVVWEEFQHADSKGLFIRSVLDHYEHGPADL